jgi:hypothetical protein
MQKVSLCDGFCIRLGIKLMSRIGKGYIICNSDGDILTVAKVAGEALYTAMQLEEELDYMPHIFSIGEYNKINESRPDGTYFDWLRIQQRRSERSNWYPVAPAPGQQD